MFSYPQLIERPRWPVEARLLLLTLGLAWAGAPLPAQEETSKPTVIREQVGVQVVNRHPRPVGPDFLVGGEALSFP